jgi:triacylglycerol lipase
VRSVVAALVGLSLAASACGSEPKPARPSPQGEASQRESAEPALRTAKAKLAAALHCQPGVKDARAAPVLLISGSGVDGSVVWPPIIQPALATAGHASCYLDFPQHTTGDLQTAAKYVSYGIRTLAARSNRKIAIYGISQGAVLPRMALTYWPSTRPLVSDAVLLAGPQHGVTPALCSDRCTAAEWQLSAGSELLQTLNDGDETPGEVSYTTLRTRLDELVHPVDGPHPTSALRGASNLVVQDLCAGRQTGHADLAFDSVSFATLLDAIEHEGSAHASRLPARVCAQPFATDLTQQEVRDAIATMTTEFQINIAAAPTLTAEPAVRLRRP